MRCSEEKPYDPVVVWMIVIALVPLLIMIVGSISRSSEMKKQEETRTTPRAAYRVVIVDGCEYLEFDGNYGSKYCHKGNCKNPIHVYRVEKQSADE